MFRNLILFLALFQGGVASASTFPQDFKWGVGSCEYQNSGAANCPDSNWAEWETQKSLDSGKSSDHYHKVDQTIAQLKHLGCNSYRFSVEWSKIEPTEGHYDEAVLTHYSEMVDKLMAAGIEPMVTLHHFSHPQWFEEKGGFVDEYNISHFVNFSKLVFSRLSNRVKLWCTINEPGVFAVQGYFFGVFPPGYHAEGEKCASVMKHMLMAHCELYRTLKEMPGGEEAKIGLVHQFLKFSPAWDKNLAFAKVCSGMTYLFHQALFDALVTGEFHMKLPIVGGTSSVKIGKANEIMDFIGVNYYSEPLMGMRLASKVSESIGSIPESGGFMTDMPFRYYPQGLYDRIMECKQLNVPIYITENGAPDRRDAFRGQWIKEHLAKVSEAIEDGADVKGFYYWTLNDNFEWDRGYSQKFGLFEYDFKTGVNKLRRGSQAYIDIIREAKVAPQDGS